MVRDGIACHESLSSSFHTHPYHHPVILLSLLPLPLTLFLILLHFTLPSSFFHSPSFSSYCSLLSLPLSSSHPHSALFLPPPRAQYPTNNLAQHHGTLAHEIADVLVWCSSAESPVKILTFVRPLWSELMTPIEDLLVDGRDGGASTSGGGGSGSASGVGGGNDGVVSVPSWTKRFSWTGRFASCSAVLTLTTRLLRPIFHQHPTMKQPPLQDEELPGQGPDQGQQQQQEQNSINEVLTLQTRALVGLLLLTGDLLTLQPSQSQQQPPPQRTNTTHSSSLGQRFDPTLLLFPLGGNIITTRHHNAYLVLPMVLSTIATLPLPQMARALVALMVLINRHDYYIQNQVTEQINTMKMVAKKDIVGFVDGINNRLHALVQGSEMGQGRGNGESVSMGKRSREEGVEAGQGLSHAKDVELIKETCKLLLDGIQSSI